MDNRKIDFSMNETEIQMYMDLKSFKESLKLLLSMLSKTCN